MAEITASLVKELREKTGAGMMDCKKALAETGGDLEAAVDWLRKKGLAAAAKKAGRVAAEGLVAVASSGKVGAAVEVNSETDFVARNEHFQGFALKAAELALDAGDIDQLKVKAFPGSSRNVGEEVTHLVATIGENMNLRRVARLDVADGIVATYMHNALTANAGKIGVLVALESTGDKAKLQELGRMLAMHVAAARPEALTAEEVDPAKIEREREVLGEKARASGKPEDVVQKMVEGGLRKYFADVVLLDQIYVIDGKSKIRDVVDAAGKDVGAPVTLKGFVRFELGEGIEKEQSDFAAEVAAQASR